jgi:hypothetical protein
MDVYSTAIPTSTRRCSICSKCELDDIEVLSGGLRLVAAGAVVDSRIVEVLVQARWGSCGDGLKLLTPREQEMLADAARGRTTTLSRVAGAIA